MSKAELMTHPLVRRCFAFAVELHGTQKRKWEDAPYWEHPWRVADDVARCDGSTPVMVGAAFLHDTLENCEIGACDLYNAIMAPPTAISDTEAGDVVALVIELTNRSKGLNLSRAERKRMDREYIARATKEAQLIKAFDRIDNLIGLCEAPESEADFVQLYCDESQLLHDALKAAGKLDADTLEVLQNYIRQARR